MHGSSRAASLLAWLLVTQTLLPARPVGAAPGDGSTLPTGRNLAPPDAGAGAVAPASDPFTGAATYEIPIEAPPGTGGMTPQLVLRYGSQARGDSWVGSGWSLGLPAITRSLAFGTPRYDDDADVFELASEELVPEDASPALPRRYHTLRESFVRIVHEASGSWTVTRKDGVAMRFGVTAQGRIANADGRVFQWLLEEQEDRHGNAFAASYDRRDPGTAYLAAVRYTLRRGAGGALESLDGLPARDRRIEFALAPRPDAGESRRAGLRSRIAHRLDHVDVRVGTALVRRYQLHYAQSADTFRSLLASVSLFGSDAASASPQAPFVTSFAYHSNVATGTTGWERASWSWPAALSLVDASRQDRGVRLADVNGDGRPDLVKALATLSDPDPARATFALTADSGVFLNTGSGFGVKSILHPLPAFTGPAGRIPFSLAWQSGGASRTTGLDVLDVTGDGRADLVGGLRDLDPASGARSLLGMPAWYRGRPEGGFEPVADVGDVLADDGWGLNRSGIVELFASTPTFGTTSGNARFADLDGDGLPELVVRGGEYRFTSRGGPTPFAGYDPVCADERIASYYFENEGGLRFRRAPVAEGAGVNCQSSRKRVATDFQHCDLDDRAGCAYGVLYNDARAIHFVDPLLGTFPWFWIWNWELGSVDVDLNGDGLADTVGAAWDPGFLGLGAVSKAWINSGRRGYEEDPAWALPAGLALYEVGASHASDTGLRFADVNGDGRVDLVGARTGDQSATWLNHGDADGAPATPWVRSEDWVVPPGLAFVDAGGADTGVRLVDLDGDGMTDLVRSADGVNELHRNRGSIPDLLIAITSPAGARTELRYDVSTRHRVTGVGSAIPFPVPVVASVTVRAVPDRPEDVAGTTTFEYDGGLYDPDARELRGFATVTETRPDGRRTIRRFHQSDALAGQLVSEQIEDAAGTPWLAIDYEYADDATPPYAALLERIERREYDGTLAPRITSTSYRYDAHGNPTAITEWGETTASGADVVPADTRTLEITYFANESTHLVDRPKRRILRRGGTPGAGEVVRESRFAYDGDATGEAPPAIGDLTRRVEVLGDAAQPDPTTTFAYDAYGNLVRTTDPRANAGEGGGSTTTEYDPVFHAFPTAVVNALGHRSELSYATAPGCAVLQSPGAGLVGQARGPNDLAAGTRTERCYDVFGRVVSETGPAGLASTTWRYDDTPLAVSVTESRATSAGASRAVRTRRDGLGRPISVERTGPAGRSVFDTAIRYDAVGRVAAASQPAFGAPGAETLYAYDVLDRTVSVTLPGAGRVHTRRIDRGLVERRDPNGNVVRERRDGLGRVERVEEVAGSETWITRYEHDAADQPTRIVDHHGNTSEIAYDRLGRRVRIADPDAGVRELRYDADGHVVAESIAGLETVTWSWDALGRPRTRHGSSPRGWKEPTVTWRWDTAPNGIGLLASRTDDAAHTWNVLAYDALGRPVRERSTLLVAGQWRNFDFESRYDGLGQLVERRHPTGAAVRLERDAGGYLTSIAAGAGEPDAAAIAWTADGRVASWTAPGGVATTARYDASMRLDGIAVVAPGAAPLLDDAYTYDGGDRVTGVFDRVGLDTAAFGYDARDRLARTTRFEDGAWRMRTNEYDAIGNLLCRDATGSGCSGGTRLEYPGAAGDPLGRAASHRAIRIGGADVTYDASGVVLRSGSRRFGYDAFGRLVEAWDGSALSLTADYDGEGRVLRLWSADAGERVFLPTGDFEWSESAREARIHVSLGGARIATHAVAFQPPAAPSGCAAGSPGAPLDLLALLAPGLAALLVLGAARVTAPHRARALAAAGTAGVFSLVALVPVPYAERGAASAEGAASSRYYHADHLGSVRIVTDAAGAVVGMPARFDAWGNLRAGSALATPFGFNGRRAAASLYDYGARWYDPQAGRFLQPDPVIADPYDPQALGRYAYVRNDPVGRVDPTGMWSLAVNAYAGQVDRFGFTGITAGFGLRAGGPGAVRVGARVGGIPIAQLAFVGDVLGAVGTAVRMGVVQLFDHIAGFFSPDLPDVGAGPPASATWRTPANLAVLDGLDPYVANLAAQHLALMAAAGLDARLLSGFRTVAQQEEKYAQGRNGIPGHVITDRRGGESLHNFALAYDIGLFDGGRYLSDGSDPRYRRAGEIGESVSDGVGSAQMEWGGRWRKPDFSHFQFDGGLPLSVIQERYEAGKPIFSFP